MGCSPSTTGYLDAPVLGGSAAAGPLRSVGSAGCVMKHEKTFYRGSRGQPETLTAQQKKLVRRSWALVLRRNLTEVGLTLFKVLFQQEPSTKLLFSLETYDAEEAAKQPRLRTHAARFMQAVGAVIDNLQDLGDKLHALLHDIGAQHSQLDTFHQVYFRSFTQALLTTLELCLGKDVFKDELKAAWVKVIEVMMDEMHRGYQEVKAGQMLSK